MAKIVRLIAEEAARGALAPVTRVCEGHRDQYTVDEVFSAARNAGYNVQVRGGSWYEGIEPVQ